MVNDKYIEINTERGVYLIDHEIWTCLRSIYGSTLVLKRGRNKEIRAYCDDDEELIIKNQKDLDTMIFPKLSSKLNNMNGNIDSVLQSSKDTTESIYFHGQRKGRQYNNNHLLIEDKTTPNDNSDKYVELIKNVKTHFNSNDSKIPLERDIDESSFSDDDIKEYNEQSKVACRIHPIANPLKQEDEKKSKII